jgi:hypothetical protein
MLHKYKYKLTNAGKNICIAREHRICAFTYLTGFENRQRNIQIFFFFFRPTVLLNVILFIAAKMNYFQSPRYVPARRLIVFKRLSSSAFMRQKRKQLNTT